MDNEYEAPRQRKKPKVKESIIDHTYRDYSQVEVSSDDETSTTAGDDKKPSRLQPNFPAKLHAIVSNPNYQHIICWQPHGRSWKIVDKHLLSTVICPKHFAHAKFESFNRSVNGWGFKRLLNPGPDCKSYYHECFLRGRPELTKLMQRLVNPGKRLPDKAGEPDFYEISRKYPLPAAPTIATQEQNTAAAGLSPHHARGGVPGQQGRFSFQPGQAGGYPYGYYSAGPYPQLPSPASSYPGQPYPPQPPQQAYWPNQMPPSLYPPNPSAYGYYPYPQMMAPQGYEQYPHPSMYGQYYPATPGAYGNPASPGRPKPAEAAAAASGPGAPQGQPQQSDEHGQYGYPPPGTRGPDRAASNEADTPDERKPSARTGLKRPLEEDPRAGPAMFPPRPSAPSHQLEGSHPSTHAAGHPARHPAAHATLARGAPGGVYTTGQPGAGNVAGESVKQEEGSNTGTERRPGPPPKQGDGINEQQLLQDFFQHF
eukprot:CAMPEP_0181121038 /NCGR_PEP_ID=MMETSP1071-20121207/24510_1 /TAXON_ID=35127 /ORGANISM="Thalassiosira sp., Strain NH16" /LENGTH=481 /DNA_ID=CAMNT_0023205801 /DNA_START=231 /DNA_END=1676 /DNA_ORIENTATION=-